MSAILWYAIPAVIIAATFALKPLRRWLESCAHDASVQTALVDEYQRNAARFIKLTNESDHAQMREVVVWAGRVMLDGTNLIRFMLLNGSRREIDAESKERIDTVVETLPEDAVHAFGRAIGAALLVSSYQSFIMGAKYRAVLRWILKGPEREIKEPEQVVYRYERARQLPHSRKLSRAV